MRHGGLERLDDLLAPRLAFAGEAISEVLQLKDTQAEALSNNYIPAAVTAPTVIRSNLDARAAVEPIQQCLNDSVKVWLA
jgi:hypothetical protein